MNVLRLLLIGLLTVVGCGDRERVSVQNPVNVVLIVVDTLRPDFLGCYGSAGDPSPAIDALAADGVLFETAIAHSPITGPSHASLFTSKFPSEVGVVNNAVTVPDVQTPMLAELLQQAGYRTGAAIAIAPVQRQWGFGRGFDVFEDHLRNTWILRAQTVMPYTLAVAADLRSPFFLWSHLADTHEPYNAHGLVERIATVWLNGRPVGELSTSTSHVSQLDLRLVRGANDLEIRSDHPFMVRRLSMRRRGWIKPQLDPEHPPAGYSTGYRATISSWRRRSVKLVIQLSDQVKQLDRAVERYRREVEYVDRHVKELVEWLRAAGLYEESLVIFTSDHGEGLGCHGYRAHVETLYDCMVRVPMIFKLPRAAGVPPGERRADLAGLVDVLPTVLAQIRLPAPLGIRGRDLFATGAEPAEPAVFMETHRPQAQRTLYGLRGARFTIIFDPAEDQWELYDMAVDPGQERNLFDPDDRLSLSWKKRLLATVAEQALHAHGAEHEVAVDENTKEMLRSLGYL